MPCRPRARQRRQPPWPAFTPSLSPGAPCRARCTCRAARLLQAAASSTFCAPLTLRHRTGTPETPTPCTPCSTPQPCTKVGCSAAASVGMTACRHNLPVESGCAGHTGCRGTPALQRAYRASAPPATAQPLPDAIRAVGSVLEHYDSDKRFPAWGFGAALPPTNTTSHCFALNGSGNDPEVVGVEGIRQAYRWGRQR